LWQEVRGPEATYNKSQSMSIIPEVKREIDKKKTLETAISSH
jgi:hypothetical protein